MRYLKFSGQMPIEEKQLIDILELSKYIVRELDIHISTYDLYKVWKCVSNEYEVDWLDIRSNPEKDKNLWLLRVLSRYCEEINFNKEE